MRGWWGDRRRQIGAGIVSYDAPVMIPTDTNRDLLGLQGIDAGALRVILGPAARLAENRKAFGQPLAGRQFAAEVDQMVFAEAAFEERSSINAGRRVPLKINTVPGKIVVAAKEMIESHLV